MEERKFSRWEVLSWEPREKLVFRDVEQFRKLSCTAKIQTSVTLIKWQKKEGEVLASLLKVQENYSEVFVSQPYVPIKSFGSSSAKGTVHCVLQRNPKQGQETLPARCGTWKDSTWHLSHWYLKWHQQMAAWNIQLTIERIFLLKWKTKANVQCSTDLNGKICNIEGPFRNRCC